MHLFDTLNDKYISSAYLIRGTMTKAKSSWNLITQKHKTVDNLRKVSNSKNIASCC